MGFFSFYTARKPRTFNHTPIYFDPRKEALDERILKAKKEMGIDIPVEEYKPNIKGALSNQTHHLKKRKGNPDKSSAATNIKLAVALVVILIAAYFLFFK